jgi:putative membrane protein
VRQGIFTKTVCEVALPTLVIVLEAIGASLLDRTTTWLRHISVPDLTLTLIGTAISIVIAFRVNAAYARWWEARTLWGVLVNSSRSLARQVLAIGTDGKDASRFAERIVELQIAYIHTLCAQLSDRDAKALVRSKYGEVMQASIDTRENAAIGVLTEIAREVHKAQQHGYIDPWIVARMDTTLSELTNAQGGCERIKSTPLPLQLRVVSETIVYLYAGLLPLALADSLGVTLPFVCGAIAFTFFALAQTGSNLEHPFAGRFYDVAIQTISNGIEKVLRAELTTVLRAENVTMN